MRVRLLSAAMALLTVGAGVAVYGGNAAQAAYSGDKLVITTSAFTKAASLLAGNPQITVQLQTNAGNPVIVTGSPLVLNLSSTGTGEFSSSSTGSPTITTVTIPVGSSSATFYYGNQTVGPQTITVHDPNPANTETNATQTETITGATVIKFVNCSIDGNNTIPTCSPQPLSVGNGSNTTFYMQTQDTSGNPVAPLTAITITFTNSDGTFSITSGSPASITTGSPTSGQVTLHHGVNGGTDTLTATASSGFAPVTLTAKK